MTRVNQSHHSFLIHYSLCHYQVLQWLCSSLCLMVQVSDFGWAKELSGGNEIYMTSDVGASLFRAPEASSSMYDSSCDVWSFGIIMSKIFECGTQWPDLQSITRTALEEYRSEISEDLKRRLGEDILRKHCKFRRHALHVISSDVFRALASRCLTFESSLRPTFNDISTELEALENQLRIPKKRIWPSTSTLSIFVVWSNSHLVIDKIKVLVTVSPKKRSVFLSLGAECCARSCKLLVRSCFPQSRFYFSIPFHCFFISSFSGLLMTYLLLEVM